MSNVFGIVFGVDSFWMGINDIKFIGLLRLVFKKEEIDHVFAVCHMPSACDIVIKKAWAKRWLGLSASWLVKIQNLTLLMGLKIANEHGGLAKTKARALMQQKRDEDVRAARALKAGEKIKRKEDEHNLFQAVLKWRAETDAIPRDFYFGSVNYMHVIREFKTFDNITERLTAIYEEVTKRSAAIHSAREETKRALDERLKAENLPCVGEYYTKCIHAGEGVTDDMIAEIRFRHAIWNNRVYDGIVKHLAFSGFYSGIHADARIIFRRRFHVGEDGRVGAENTHYMETQYMQDVDDFREEGMYSMPSDDDDE